MKKMIIQVVQHLQPGGIETMVLDFLRLSDNNETLLLVSMEGNKEEAIANWPRLESYRGRLIFLNKPSGWHLSSFIKLYRLFKQYKPYVVHTHHIGPLIYAASMARLNNVKHIIHTEHDAWHLHNKKRRYLQRFIIKMIKPIVIADADEVSNNLKKFIQIDATVIKNGIDCEQFNIGNITHARKYYQLPLKKRLVGTAGRLEGVKAQYVLISAMHYLPDDIHLVIAGIGSEQANLKEQAKLMKIEKRVHFLGLVEDMPAFYQSLNVFCLPSLNEGLPLSILEAQSCNIPVVASDVGGIPEAVCPQSGRLVSVKNPQQLAKNIAALLAIQTPIEKRKEPRCFVLKHGNIKIMHQQYRCLWKT